ncbi:hypothetical protein RMATCC62417_13460 [Rhizopus microsporus]|nr:hypothetical protein RMATCC62417_13460 [Rhizopus microsporus]
MLHFETKHPANKKVSWKSIGFAPLSPERHLIFNNDLSNSVTKYFGTNIHQAIMSNLRFGNYRPERPNKALIWCQGISEDLPSDFLSCLSVCSRHMTEAAEKKSNIDAYTAHVLTQILPLLITG